MHQAGVHKITDIIRKSIVEGLGFQVFLTTHNDKTVAYLENKTGNSATQVRCFIMDSKDGLVKITKYEEFLGAKLLLDSFYITMFKTGRMTIYQQQQIILNFPRILDSDYSMELLFERHSEEKTTGYLNFLNHIGKGKWCKEDLEFKRVENLYFSTDVNELASLLEIDKKVTIVWPTNKYNKSFDCLILFAKKLAFFCQITARDAIKTKIEEVFEKKKISNYTKIFKQLTAKQITVNYILIHGNEKEKYTCHTKETLIENKRTKESNVVGETKIECYSFQSLDEDFKFDDVAMRNIHIRKKDNYIKVDDISSALAQFQV